ncbi:hypothetical protein D3C73_1506690 [compost metagenome]
MDLDNGSGQGFFGFLFGILQLHVPGIAQQGQSMGISFQNSPVYRQLLLKPDQRGGPILRQIKAGVRR